MTTVWTSWTNTTCTTGSAWQYWCDHHNQTSAGITVVRVAESPDVWGGWIDGGTDTRTAETTTTNVWIGWTTAGDETRIELRQGDNVERAVITRHAEASGQLVQQRLARQALDEKRRKREARMKLLRAKRLLKENLDAEQKKMLMENDCFYVRGKSGQMYRIRQGRVANVDKVSVDNQGDEKVTHRLCAHPSSYCPNYDTMLAQKLMLETDEQRFLQIANETAVMH